MSRSGIGMGCKAQGRSQVAYLASPCNAADRPITPGPKGFGPALSIQITNVLAGPKPMPFTLPR